MSPLTEGNTKGCTKDLSKDMKRPSGPPPPCKPKKDGNGRSAFYLQHILDNAELFSEWVQEGRKPKDFLLTIPSEVTDEDIRWAQESLGIRS